MADWCICASDIASHAVGRLRRPARGFAWSAAALLCSGGGVAVHAEAPGARYIPQDPLFERQWYLDNPATGADIDAPEAWSITRGSPDIVIAVLDDGVDAQHPDLAGKLLAGRDFSGAEPLDGAVPRHADDRHGTAVAGIAAADGNNGLGMIGACPGCTLLPIRIDRNNALGTAAAFRYAVEQGADIITNSWGYARAAHPDRFELVSAAIELAAQNGRGGRGAVVVFGLTNQAVDNCADEHFDLAALPSVIAVGVADHLDSIGGSGYGDCMDLVAPAKPRYRGTLGTLTTDRRGSAGYTGGDYHESFGGTSAAAPLVAGVAGLLLSLNPQLTAAEVQRILEHSADRIDPARAQYDASGFSPSAGYGRLNAGRAVRPIVRIRISPAEVAVGEPFSVTVTASAPYGVERISWRNRDAGPDSTAWLHDEVDGGQAYYERTWAGLAAPREGFYRFEARVRDAAHALDDDYPHASESRNDSLEGLLSVRGVSP